MERQGKPETDVWQCTLENAISCTGMGLHSGAKVSMSLSPAGTDHGIHFKRTDIGDAGVSIPARWDRVTDTRLCTTIGSDEGVTVATIEHLMAALAGCGVDNAVVEIDGPEVPAMDGSSAPFVFLIECAGIAVQDKLRKGIEVLKPISVGDSERSAVLTPGKGFSLSFEIDFANPQIARQGFFIDMKNGAFRSELCRARTFGFEDEVEQMRAAGFARGGSLDNAVVVNGKGVLNEDGLRYEDEFVRHKLLDSVGDLYLAGAPLRGHFHGFRSGHMLNNALLRALFADRDAWQMVDLTSLDADGDTGSLADERLAASA